MWIQIPLSRRCPDFLVFLVKWSNSNELFWQATSLLPTPDANRWAKKYSYIPIPSERSGFEHVVCARETYPTRRNSHNCQTSWGHYIPYLIVRHSGGVIDRKNGTECDHIGGGNYRSGNGRASKNSLDLGGCGLHTSNWNTCIMEEQLKKRYTREINT